eukprot:8513829-Lingulodinium_polyedra.AAC.1
MTLRRCMDLALLHNVVHNAWAQLQKLAPPLLSLRLNRGLRHLLGAPTRDNSDTRRRQHRHARCHFRKAGC